MVDVTLPDDAIVLADSLTKDLSYGRVLTDIPSVTDLVNGGLILTRAASDTLDVTDQGVGGFIINRVLSTDTLSCADQVGAVVTPTEVVAQDSLDEITEQVIVVLPLVKEVLVSDTVATTDSCRADRFVYLVLSDTIDTEDESGSGYVLFVNVQDTISCTDAPQVDIACDEIHVLDVAIASLTLGVVATDAFSTTDETFRQTTFPRDTVSVTDAASTSLEIAVSASDFISIDAEGASSSVTYVRAGSDALSTTDSAAGATTKQYNIDLGLNMVSVTDSVTRDRTLYATVNDNIVLTDASARSVPFVRSVADTVSFTDSTSVTSFRVLADAVAVTDSVARDTSRGLVFTENLVVTDQLRASTQYTRPLSDTVAIAEQLTVFASRLVNLTFSEALAVTDYVLAEAINVDVVVPTDHPAFQDDLLREAQLLRRLTDTLTVTDTILAKLGGVVDRSAADTLAVSDSVAFKLFPGELLDVIVVKDALTVERLTPLPIVMDSDGYGLTVRLPGEIRYDRLEETPSFHFRPFPGEGVPFQVLAAEPEVEVRQTGGLGEVVYQGGQMFFSPFFSITGGSNTTAVTVVDRNVLTVEKLVVSDSYAVEVLGASPVTLSSGFSGGDVGNYLEVLSGGAPGLYRIVSVVNPQQVKLDRPLPVVDNMNGRLDWKLTSAVQGLHFRTSQKVTNQANYSFRAQELLTKDGDPFEYSSDFYTSGINGPRVVGTSVSDEGYVLVEYDQPMRSDHDLVFPNEYTITGPTTVRVKRAWSTGSNEVALETGGLDAGSYMLHVNYTGTPKDVAGNPIDPLYSEAAFTGAIPLGIRSVFTDKGPIAKPGETIQSGFGAIINSITEVTLPGASLSASQIGYYIRLGSLGRAPTSSSSVVGHAVTINDTVTAPDALKVELVGASSSSYTSLSGVYRLEGIVSSTRARVSASFPVNNPSNGTLYWELINPRNGEIADDPSDVTVKINGSPVVPQAVLGLLGQVVLNAIPAPDDDVKIDYSWVCNPTVEFRRLNSREFRLNSWNRDVSANSTSSQHRYRYNNTLLTPTDYEPLDTLATLAQPETRELHYRAYERAYTPTLNDPTTLLLNSPIHKIAFPPASRSVSEDFVLYEADVLPEVEDWTRHGVGATSVSAGVLTVTDNTSGDFPYGQPIFWTKDLDLTFPHAFALSWRFFVDTVTVLDGVFTGVSIGYTDENAAYVVGFLDVGGVRKIGLLKRGAGDDPSLVSSWIGGINNTNNPTNAPATFDWHVLHSYRIFRDLNGVIRLFVDGDVVETLRILPEEAPFLEELGSPFEEIQGVFFGSISRPAENSSKWDFVRYLILPTNPLQTSPSSFVSYEANVQPEVDTKPWTPIGFHGTETILSSNYLLLDSTSATDASTASVVGLMGGDYKGFIRMEPLLTAASQVAIDVSVQLRTYTHGVDPYGLMFAVDDGTQLTQVAFLNDREVPKFSYGGRSLPEDFSPYVWSALGGADASLVGRLLRIHDTTTSDGKVYFIEDPSLPTSDARVMAAGTDYFLEFRNRVISFTVDGSGYAGAFAQIFDGTRALGIMLSVISGSPVVQLHSDGVPVVAFNFNWNDSKPHTYRFAKSTGGNLVTLFIDGSFVGSANYSAFGVSSGNAQVSFGSSTPSSVSSLSDVEWTYCNAWRTRADLKHYVGIWKGYDDTSLTGYHLPLKAFGRNATVVGNALGDVAADFYAANVAVGDKLIVDAGPNKGVYDITGVSSSTSLTVPSTWALEPTLADYRIVKETDWTVLHKYRLVRDTTGDVSLLFENDAEPIVRVGYNSIDLPGSGTGILKTITSGLPAIAWGSFSSENLEQSYWDYVRYGITRTPYELRIAPHHQVLNQWNVMQSPERLYTLLPHSLTSYRSSSTGVIPKTDPDFLANPGLQAFTRLNDSTPLVPSTQTFEVRAPYASQTYVSVLNSPDDILNSEAFTLNDGTVQYRLIVPDDVLYTSLDVIEQSTGEEGLLAPFGDCCGPNFSGLDYTKEVCLTYEGDVLPENDTSAPTPWTRQSDVPGDVFVSTSGGVLTYGTAGSKTVYKNNTTLVDAPGLQTEVSFRIRLRDDATLGTGDTQVRFGISAPGLTVALAFVTTAIADRFVLVFDLNNGALLGSISFDFLDGLFHTYRIVRDPVAGMVRISIDSGIVSSSDIALTTDRPFVTDETQRELM